MVRPSDGCFGHASCDTTLRGPSAVITTSIASGSSSGPTPSATNQYVSPSSASASACHVKPSGCRVMTVSETVCV